MPLPLYNLLETIVYVLAGIFLIYWIVFFAKQIETWRYSSENAETVLNVLFIIGLIIAALVGYFLPFWYIAK